MSRPSLTQQILGILGWLALCFAIAALGAWASINASSFYGELARPSWAPPAWLFGPVWSALYFMMAVAAWLAWRERGFAGARGALTLFLVQLAANALWSWLFFGWKLGALASVEVIVLWALILATLMAFWRIRPLAGALLLPYLAWVSFATVLCITIWRMNPALL